MVVMDAVYFGKMVEGNSWFTNLHILLQERDRQPTYACYVLGVESLCFFA